MDFVYQILYSEPVRICFIYFLSEEIQIPAKEVPEKKSSLVSIEA